MRALARGVALFCAALVLSVPPPQAGALPAEPTLLENGAYGPALLRQIRNAQRRIICVFYLFKVGYSPKNGPRILADELVAAQKRGVRVTVVLEGGRSVGRENMAAAGLLLRGGVAVVFHAGRTVTHAKAVSIDDRYVFVGSHNLTQSALKHNNELSILVDSPRLAARISDYLQRIR